MTNPQNQLSRQIGESLVVAILGRLRILATPFAGNVPDIDILAYKNGKTRAIQVKAWCKGSVNFDAKTFLEIEKRDYETGETLTEKPKDGRKIKQIIKGPKCDLKIIFVLVKLPKELDKKESVKLTSKLGKDEFIKLVSELSKDEFYIIPQDKLRDHIHHGYKDYLSRNDGRRPDGGWSTHTGIAKEFLNSYKDRWDIIDAAFV